MPIVGSAVATAIFGAEAVAAGGFAVVATETAVNLALGIGLQLAGNLLTKKPETTTGTNLQVKTGGVVPRSLLVGHSVTPGSLVYANVWGKIGKTPNAYVSVVYAVADKRCGAPTNIWVNDTLCAWPDMSGSAPYAQGWPLSEFTTGSNNRAWARWYDGTQTEADSFLVNQFGSDANYPWESTAVGKGIAYAVLTFQYDTEYFSGGIPALKFVTPGCYWYDPRQDSSVGGSGTQRWSDEASWATTNNPAVHLYNILLGVHYGGKWMYGLQDMVAARLPLDSWFAAMNECDAAITQADGSTLPQYQAGGEISLDTKPADAVNALLTACAGRLSEVAGIYKLHVGAPGTAVLSFGDADIISTEPQTYAPFPSITATINAITGKYPEPESAWASTDAPPLYNPDYETADGDRELPSDVSYDMVPYKEQVQRLMKSALQEARRFRQATYVLPAWARCLEPGDFVSVTDSRNGFDAKLFRVDDLKYMSSLDVTVTLTEVDPSDYDWNPDADYTPVVPVPPQIVLPAVQEMTGWSAQGVTLEDSNGNARRPAIQVFYDGDLDDVQNISVEVYLKSSGARLFQGTSPYGDPTTNAATESVIISFAAILPNTEYQVRGKYLPYSSRVTNWSDLVDVTTPNVLFGPYDVDLSGLIADLNDLNSWVLDGTRELLNQSWQTALSTADQDAGQYTDKQTLLTTLTSTAANITAAYQAAITVATGPDSALSQQITSLSATVAGKADTSVVTLLQSTVTTQGNQITANSDAITSLNTTVNGVTANGTFRIETGYTPSAGWTSRIGMQASVSGGTFVDAGLFLEATATSSRVLIEADQFVIFNGSNLQQPFVFSGGVAQMNVANIGTVNAGLINALSGKMVIDLNNGYISISD